MLRVCSSRLPSVIRSSTNNNNGVVVGLLQSLQQLTINNNNNNINNINNTQNIRVITNQATKNVGLKIYNPTSPGQRGLVRLKNSHLAKKPLVKTNLKGEKLVVGMKNNSGRNNTGQITVRHIGGGHKQRYRNVDFVRTKPSVGVVTSIEYDPNRTANIASVYDTLSSTYSYILAPKNLNIGDIVKSGPNAETKLGHSLPLSKIPVGTLIHNVATSYNAKGIYARSAGTFCQIVEKTSKYVRIKLPGGSSKFLTPDCFASIGIVSNELHNLTTIAKAGRSRWMNRRPSVRGVAMNPVDHPNGGGEGKKSGKSMSPWGTISKTSANKLKKKKSILKRDAKRLRKLMSL